MAFTVTPTSGDAPYLYEAQFSNKDLLNGIDYELTFRERTVSGSCPNFGDIGAQRPQSAANLLEFGQHTDPSGNVPEGSCRASSLVIKNILTGNIIDVAGVHIDNV